MRFILKFLERATWGFPPFYFVGIIFLIHKTFFEPSWSNFLLLSSFIWLLPLALYRVISTFFPIHIGRMPVGPEHPPCAWFIAYRLQLAFMIFPALERVLLLLPGIYSIWLRLWGSKIGKMVYFAPDVRILDRTHLNIGDKTFVGGSTLSCHFVIKHQDQFILDFNPIKIGQECFIAAQCNLGPGSIVKDHEVLRPLTQAVGTTRRELV